jgi:hypothetical protein
VQSVDHSGGAWRRAGGWAVIRAPGDGRSGGTAQKSGADDGQIGMAFEAMAIATGRIPRLSARATACCLLLLRS